ncbi:hypothetical protein CBS101457_002843 [Exobasidium rhododendri]|nr:hypothetical protein CBS101457_002843 [Exobasidium rhododendri]
MTKSTAKLRVQVVGAQGLAGKDRNGLSDPFIVVNLPGAPPPAHSTKKDKGFYRRATPVQPKTLEPKWKGTEATFEWDITPDWYQSAKEHDGPGTSEDQQVAQELLNSAETGKDGDGCRVLKAPSSSGDAQLTQSPKLGSFVELNASEGAYREVNELKPPSTSSRPSSVRRMSAVTTKLLIAPVRLTTKGAVATTRAVRRRGPPRPMRLRKGAKSSNGTIDLSTIHQHQGNVGAIEFVVWDKDKWSGNDYMGECSIRVSSWVADGDSAEWGASQSFTIPLTSSRRHAKVSGEIVVKIGLVASNPREADEVYNKLLLASRSVEGAGIRSIPADQSVGMSGPTEAFVDDGLDSDSESEAREELLTGDEEDQSDSAYDDTDADDATTTEVDEAYESDQAIPGIPIITTSAEQEVDEEPKLGEEKSHDRPRRRLLPKRLRKSSPSNVNAATTSEDGITIPAAKQRNKKKLKTPGRKQSAEKQSSTDSQQNIQRKRERRKRRHFALQTELGMDIIGIVQMEIKSAQDLPRWKNSLGTGFDMDAFVIASFGQRIFRTRVARHSLNPTWDEKLLFHVRQHEINYVTKLAIYDWDKLSSNDFVASTELKLADLVDAAPKPNSETGLYEAFDDNMHKMKHMQLALTRDERSEEGKSLGKHNPTLTVEAKFTPYSALRQRFWRQILTQYDTNDSGTLSSLELTSMLDSLGSTLTRKTIETLFSQFGKKDVETDELTVDEAIIALEREISKPWSEKRYVDNGWDHTPDGSGMRTPAVAGTDPTGGLLDNTHMDYSGPNAPSLEENELADKSKLVPSAVIDGVTEEDNPKSVRPSSRTLDRDMSNLTLTATPSIEKKDYFSKTNSPSSGVARSNTEEEGEEQVERVIVLKSCPLCHMSKLSKKAEVDIVTHLAVCASQDWRRVDSMVVNNFVTASQAHRKWYTKVISKISQGQYRLGADSANIIVQDRLTGELLEEKMQVYVRLGIRLLYKGARSRMEGARIRKMLKNMSVKQGIRYDSPNSAREIPQFIAFHNLSLDEIRDPLESYKTFNQFFYRKLKEGVRPIADPQDPTVIVSSADCRLMAFPSITEATKLWIKGREFTVERLLGEKYKDKVDSYRTGGSLVIFRLAPQDYHRFHCPADAKVEEITFVEGQYYTVNPMAIRSGIDIYGENVRAIVQFRSDVLGVFYCVCIGAMMVGSINLTVKEGDSVKKGDEFGYYAFGGSTNICIFEQGKVELDEDLVANSRKATETLVRVGMRIGKAVAS